MNLRDPVGDASGGSSSAAEHGLASIREALDLVLDAVPREMRARAPVRLLYELERLHASVDVPCPRWLVSMRADLVAREGGGAVIGTDDPL